MDKFVIRATSWKTKTYNEITSTRVKSDKKLLFSSRKPAASPNKPLQDKQQNTFVKGYRLSIRDEQLLQIFASSPDQPLIVNNEVEESLHDLCNNTECIENIKPKTMLSNSIKNQNNLCNLSDYVSCPKQPEAADSSGSRYPPIAESVSFVDDAMELFMDNERPGTPNELLLIPCDPITPKSNPVMARIQRDLNSPSAMARVRALKALKCPTQSAYNQFDVPHDEQSIITAEERCTPPPPPSIEDLMRNVIIYVEVRTGEDNRSAGVKKVISALGARVNDKLLRDTTHVIFKDGLLSTYKKAKSWNIPIVSILWIEACRNQHRICDPKDFPISSIDRYENPELYDKMKRHKSMQPDSECNKRVRPKLGTPKDSTPKTATTGRLKKTANVNGITKTPGKEKTDISKYFKSLDNNNPQNTNTEKFETPPSTSPHHTPNSNSEGPPKVYSNTRKQYTPLTTIIIKRKDIASTDNLDGNGAGIINFQGKTTTKDCDVETPKNMPSRSTKRITNHRRNSMYASCETTKNAPEDMSLSQTPTTTRTVNNTELDTPSRVTRRRCSMNAVASGIIPKANVKKRATPIRDMSRTEFTSIAEEGTIDGHDKGQRSQTPTKNLTAHRKVSIISNKTMDTSNTIDVLSQTDHHTMFSALGNDVSTQTDPSAKHRRRTLYTPQRMEMSAVDNYTAEQNSKADCTTSVFKDKQMQIVENATTNTDPLCVSINKTPKNIACSTFINDNKLATDICDTLIEEHAANVPFNSTRRPGHRRTLFDVSIDIITQRLENINQSARKSMAANSTETVNSNVKVAPNSSKGKATPLLKRCSTSPTLSETCAVSSEKPKENESKTGDETGEVATPRPITKKRKLFMPNDSPLALTPKDTADYVAPSSNSKRRKTLMPLTQPQPQSKLTATITSSAKKKICSSRRSTMDFESVHNAKTTLAKTNTAVSEMVNKSKPNKKSPTSRKHQSNTHKQTTAITVVNRTKLPYLVCTNMHKDQIDFIREVGTER